jgi:hypothetical protein
MTTATPTVTTQTLASLDNTMNKVSLLADAQEVARLFTDKKDAESEQERVEDRLAEAMAKYPELVEIQAELDEKKKATKDADKAWKARRDQLAERVTGKQLDADVLPDGVTQARYEELEYKDDLMVNWAIRKGLHRILTVDKKKVQTLMPSNDAIDLLEAPAYRTEVYKARISDKVLLKNVPDIDPKDVF